jgi:hypothetical protein
MSSLFLLSFFFRHWLYSHLAHGVWDCADAVCRRENGEENDRYRIESLRGEWAVRIHHFIIAVKDLKKKVPCQRDPSGGRGSHGKPIGYVKLHWTLTWRAAMAIERKRRPNERWGDISYTFSIRCCPSPTLLLTDEKGHSDRLHSSYSSLSLNYVGILYYSILLLYHYIWRNLRDWSSFLMTTNKIKGAFRLCRGHWIETRVQTMVQQPIHADYPVGRSNDNKIP